MIEVIELTREEKESWIRNGIRPCGSDINCIQSIVSNVLKTNFNWERSNGILTITADEVTITFGDTTTFQWKS
jgi:hypothetical protein